jgi:dihydroorotate dehydrogenase (NAD+) catalytic subunit
MKPSRELEVTIGELTLKTPLIAASGTVGFGAELSELGSLSSYGAIVLKTITCQKRDGNPSPRVIETPSGMLNAIGLQNPGIDAFISHHAGVVKDLSVPVVVSIGGQNKEELCECARRCEKEQCKIIELNLSCPNVHDAVPNIAQQQGVCIAQDSAAIVEVVHAVRKEFTGHLWVKLSPEVTSIPVCAGAAAQAGADAIVLINTIRGMVIDTELQQPFLGAVCGGLSGPAVRPLGVRCVYEAYKAVDIPVIGVGGICSARDVLEYMLAGAAAVQIGTLHFVDARIVGQILQDLNDYVRRHKVSSIRDIKGAAHNTL